MSTASTPDTVKHLPVTSVDEPMFFVVSPRKLIIMSILTASFYSLYWFYQNWRLYKRHSGESLWPLVRTIFGIFFIHGLLKRVDRQIKLTGRTYGWSPLLLTCAIWLLCIVYYALSMLQVLDPSPLRAMITIVLSTALGVWWSLTVQRAINFCVGDPEGESNSALSCANGVWILLGLLMWALALAPILLTPQASFISGGF
ncbi:hypothetical protein G7Z99_17365 [Pseudomonas entomophila]|uniref:hypothetical protein n=1 Tax=Pseudomonas entomophila TaxID=312306 RepID=UPI0015E2C819|nr:hypothetical protein [Pseudomonas entomophila]MBA1190797.1 hypothetical protein [Pseudomonas entomophila]